MKTSKVLLGILLVVTVLTPACLSVSARTPSVPIEGIYSYLPSHGLTWTIMGKAVGNEEKMVFYMWTTDYYTGYWYWELGVNFVSGEVWGESWRVLDNGADFHFYNDGTVVETVDGFELETYAFVSLNHPEQISRYDWHLVSSCQDEWHKIPFVE